MDECTPEGSAHLDVACYEACAPMTPHDCVDLCTSDGVQLNHKCYDACVAS